MSTLRLGIDASNLKQGGGITHLVELCRAFHLHMYGIGQVVVWSGQKTLVQLPPEPWLTPATDPLLNQKLISQLYWQKFKLPDAARQNCDILFAPGGSYSGNFHPFVSMSQNMLPFEPIENRRYGISWMFLKMNLLRPIQTASFRQADGMIFLTEHAKTVVMEYVKTLSGFCKIIPHGIGNHFRLEPRPARPIATYSQSLPFRLLYISNVLPYKHQWAVVKAVYELRRAGFWVELDLVGSAYAYPPSLQRLRKITQQVDPDGKFIHYHGEVPYAELHHWYYRADGFIFASSCENFSITLLEAMAAGLPIACSNRGPMPELLGDAGIYFDPERLETIIEALASLLQDNKLRDYHASLAHKRAKDYTWERCARETLDFISQTARRYNGITISDH
jgi:glycosyltransferase involved in cell wall biosynthesis